MNIAIRTLPTNIDPVSLLSGHHVVFFQSVFQTLVRYSENGEIQASIAKSWKFSENNKKIEFTLDDAKFSNGDSVTANDVAFSITRHLDKNKGSMDRLAVEELITGADRWKKEGYPSGIKVLNNNKISIELNKPYPAFMSMLAIPSFSIVKEVKGKVIGSGPFIVKKISEIEIITSRNIKFNLEAPKSETIVFIPYNDPIGAKKLIEQKNVDMIFWGTDSYDQSLIKNNNFNILKMENPVFVHMFSSSEKGFLKSKEKRKYFNALLQDFLTKSKFKNKEQKIINNLIPKGLLPKTYYRKRDYKTNTKITDKNRYKLLISSSLFSKEFGEELKNYFKAYGINISVDQKKGRDYLKSAVKTQDYDLVIASYAADFPDVDGIFPPISGSGGWTFGNFDNSRILKKFNEAKYSFDLIKRNSNYIKIIHEFEDEFLVYPMFSDVVKVFYRKEIQVPKTSFRYEAEFWKLFWNI